jgi:hypothetical protein
MLQSPRGGDFTAKRKIIEEITEAVGNGATYEDVALGILQMAPVTP